MMLTYPTFMHRLPPFAAAGHAGLAVGAAQTVYPYPQLAPVSAPQFMLAPQQLNSFGIQLSPKTNTRASSTDNLFKEKDGCSSEENTSKGSQSSFSIASILADDKAQKSKKQYFESSTSPKPTVPVSYQEQQVPSISPATPLSGGPNPGSQFYYLYPPPTHFSFAPAQSCLDSELMVQPSGIQGRLTAPVAVISEIVRNAG